jgi:hypothetical protein
MAPTAVASSVTASKEMASREGYGDGGEGIPSGKPGVGCPAPRADGGWGEKGWIGMGE